MASSLIIRTIFVSGICPHYNLFHLARHVTSRHDSTRSACSASRDERVEPCCSNMADN